LAALAGLPVLEGARLFLAGFFFRGLTVFDAVLVLAVDLVARDGFLFCAAVLAVVFFVVALFFLAAGFVFLLVFDSPEMSLSMETSCAALL
jgi:hypothetical protein